MDQTFNPENNYPSCHYVMLLCAPKYSKYRNQFLLACLEYRVFEPGKWSVKVGTCRRQLQITNIERHILGPKFCIAKESSKYRPHSWSSFMMKFLHITSNRFPPGGCHIRCTQAGAAILHGPAENVFSTKVGTLDSNAGG